MFESDLKENRDKNINSKYILIGDTGEKDEEAGVLYVRFLFLFGITHSSEIELFIANRGIVGVEIPAEVCEFVVAKDD